MFNEFFLLNFSLKLGGHPCHAYPPEVRLVSLSMDKLPSDNVYILKLTKRIWIFQNITTNFMIYVKNLQLVIHHKKILQHSAFKK